MPPPSTHGLHIAQTSLELRKLIADRLNMMSYYVLVLEIPQILPDLLVCIYISTK